MSALKKQKISNDDDRWGWKAETKDLMRAIAGGALIGLPLIYTMEMWWQGLLLSAWHLLALLLVILAVNFAFDLLSGFREEYSVSSALMESVTSVGIGIIFSIIVLWLIGELSADTAPQVRASKILLQAMVVSIGVSFANSQVGKQSRSGDDNPGNEEDNHGDKKDAGETDRNELNRQQLRSDLQDIGATLAGSCVFAMNIAPTEEVVMIASRLSPLQLLLLLLFSILLCYIILFASGFENQPVYVESIFQKPWPETVMACSLSLLVTGGLIMLFGQRQLVSDPAMFVAGVITLGMPAIVGGAAGRLVA